jgi:DNA-binding transcriptional regulator YiaG
MDKIDIKVLRIKLGLTQALMAKRLGVSPVTVSRWEIGAYVPSKMALDKLKLLEESEKYGEI